jgi:pimeloyl-ACP methyl ester carboxylesterase
MILKILQKIKKNKVKTIVLSVLFAYLLFCQSCMMMRMSKKQTKQFFNNNKVNYLDTLQQIDEYTVHYIQTGKKEATTLFFVHGSPGSWDAYKSYLKDSLLLQKYRMIAVDRIGFGYSNFGQAQNLRIHATVLEKLLAKLSNGKPIYLIGHSYGGPIIVQMAADYPKAYSHLVILSGALDPAAETPEKWRSIIKTKPLRYIIPGALRPSNDELWWLKKELYLLQTKLKNITTAVTIIHGTKDPLVPFSNVAFMKNELNNAKSLEIIPIQNANHFIPWEHYDTIRNKLLIMEK